MSRLKAYEIRNNNGGSARILNLGARIIELNIPTKQHGLINTVLGYDNLARYQQDDMYHGAMIGRCANRIANGQFTLNNQIYLLDKNNQQHHLHGGENGCHQLIWQVEEQTQSDTLILSTQLRQDNDGYPGTLDITVTYRLTDENELKISWTGYCDQDSYFNMTSHSYFNLSGFGDIKQHYLRIPSEDYTPVDHQQIPLGPIMPVRNSPFDLTEFIMLGPVIDSQLPDILEFGGFDHNWAGIETETESLRGELYSPDTQLLMKVYATVPGLQCYTGNQLALSNVHGSHEGVCLEPQYFPDTPNQPEFPSCEIKANQRVSHSMTLKFCQITLLDLTNG